MKISNKLRYLRKSKGLTIKQLSDITGLTTVSISNYENGHVVPGVLSLQRLTEALDVTFDELKDAVAEEKSSKE